MISKMKMSALAGAMTAAGLLAFAGQAGAAVYTATYTGQIAEVLAEGTYADFFAGRDISVGMAFTAVFRWDEANASPLFADQPPIQSVYYGPSTATITIGALNFALAAPGPTEGIVGHTDEPEGRDSVIVHHLDSRYAPGLRNVMQLYTTGGVDLLSTWDWRVEGTIDLSGANGRGAFAFEEYDAGGVSIGLAGALLTPTSLTVVREGDMAAVPEPGAWALMILGFGAAGAMLRRRRARGRDFSPRVHIPPPRST